MNGTEYVQSRNTDTNKNRSSITGGAVAKALPHQTICSDVVPVLTSNVRVNMINAYSTLQGED